jgi:hypothetical protein
MVQRLHLTMEIAEQPDGSFEAHCPELSLSARGRFSEEAIDRLKEMVFSSMAGGFDSSFTETRPFDLLHTILSRNHTCFLFLPPDRQVH